MSREQNRERERGALTSSPDPSDSAASFTDWSVSVSLKQFKCRTHRIGCEYSYYVDYIVERMGGEDGEVTTEGLNQ